MSWRTTLCVWALAGFMWALGLGLAPRSEADGYKAQAMAGLGTIPLQAVERIEIARSDRAWVFAREADGWWQIEPFRHRVNPDLLMAVPATLESLDVIDRIGSEDPDMPTAADIGLEPPDARVRIVADETGGGEALSVELGRRGMAGRAWMRQRSSGGLSQLLVVAADLHDLIASESPETWRDLRVFPGLSVDATRLERTVSGETLVLERKGRRWRIAAPLPTRADANAVAKHVSEIAGVRGEAVLLDEPDDVSAFGLAPPVAVVAVDVDDQRMTLLVGDRVGVTSQARYGMVEGVPSIIRIASDDVARLLGDPTALVDHTATDVSAADVGTIRVMRRDDELLLQRNLDVWECLGRGRADTDVIEGLLHVLIDTRAAEVALHDVYPAELEIAVITLLDREGGPLDTVRVLREPDSAAGPGRWAMENGDKVLRIMPDGTDVPIYPAEFGLSGTP